MYEKSSDYGLFPAGAGVILPLWLAQGTKPSVPRRGGGAPMAGDLEQTRIACSPQGRGCPQHLSMHYVTIGLFPAGAGVPLPGLCQAYSLDTVSSQLRGLKTTSYLILIE